MRASANACATRLAAAVADLAEERDGITGMLAIDKVTRGVIRY